MSQINNDFSLLEKIESPADLRKLSHKELPELCTQLRHYLIQTLAACGGHFAAGLGAVEITVALHYVFDTPNDKLLWDVGHQTYPHKILSGRREQLSSIRKKDGLAPFPKRAESEYDTFGVGHSSTSISAAIGMAEAFKQNNLAQKSVAIIGDGGITAGITYEAMNHLGALNLDVLIILNDNEMSISPNVGAMTNYLTRIISSKLYTSVMKGGKKLLDPVQPISEILQRTKGHLKGMIMPGTLFEELGIHYYGPLDGHNVQQLVKALEALKQLDGPRLLHIVTKKGKGYAPAEKDPVGYHAVSRFNLQTGSKKAAVSTTDTLTYSEVFSQWVCDMATTDQRLAAITPAMREGSGLVEFANKFPERYFDVGIAEQHAITFAAGLACEGMKPIVAIYSTFLQRAYDQLIHDVAVQKLPVLFAVDRAGLVGPDGPTHAGSFDLSYLRCIPNLLIMAPSNEAECRKMLSTGFAYDGPSVVRYPRGKGCGIMPTNDLDTLEISVAKQLRTGTNIAILNFGSTVQAVLEAAENLQATVFDMRFIKPLDERTIMNAAAQHNYLVTVEDNAKLGGAGSGVNEVLAAQQNRIPILNLGLPDSFQEHGSRDELLTEAGLDTAGIEKSIRNFI